MALPPIGAPVFVWGRPQRDLILLFGEGVYEGLNNYMHPPCPVVKLVDGREYTVHYAGVWVGLRDDVKKQCESFKGDVIQWDLAAFVRGEMPSREQRTADPINSVNLPPPKTATDRLMYIKREIDLENAKIALHEKAIETSRNLIADKRAEAAAMKASVLAELSALDDVPPEAILAAAEKIKASQAALIKDVVAEPQSRDEFMKLAIED